MQSTNKITIYCGIAILVLACGGAAALLPSWSLDFEHSATLRAAHDHQSLFLIENLANENPVSVKQLDLDGQEINRAHFPTGSSGYNVTTLPNATLLLRHRAEQTRHHVLLHMADGSVEPVFSESFSNTYPSFDYSLLEIRDDGSLVLAGKLEAEEQTAHTIGIVTEPGSFNHFILPDYVANASFATMGNTNGFIVAANFTEEYAATSPYKGFIQFRDAELNVVSEIPLTRTFRLRYGFNDRAYGFFSGEDDRYEYKFVDISGNELPRASFLSGGTLYQGKEFFYAYNHKDKGIEYCRYDYSLELHNCFLVPEWGYYQMVKLLPDDGLGITEYRDNDLIVGLNISIDQIGDALLAAGTVPGVETYDVRQRTYDPDGTAIMDARTVTYKEEGEYYFCHPGLPWLCFEPKKYTAGVCQYYGTEFLSATQVASFGYWCDDTQSGTPHLDFWQQ